MVRCRIEEGEKNKTTSQWSCGYLGDFSWFYYYYSIAYAIDRAEKH